MTKLLKLLAIAWLAQVAAADEIDFAPVSSLHVDLEQVVELGTVSPVDGVTSAGQPGESALEVFADVGYAAVIDLRLVDEDRGFDQQAVVEDLGMHYVALQIDGPAAITYENARNLDDLIAEHDGPVLVHCRSGNRVGALLALRASLHGADDAEALELGRDAGLGDLEGRVREVLENGSE